jgi:hypothetical protein
LIVSEISGTLGVSLFDNCSLLAWYRVRRLLLFGASAREKIIPRDLLVIDFLVGVGVSAMLSVGGKGGLRYEKHVYALPDYAARCHLFA